MRNATTRFGLAIVLAAAVISGIAFTGNQDARAKTEYEPVCNLKDIMNALNDEKVGFFGVMKAFADENPGKDDERWSIMRHRAALLGEGGQLLTEMDAPKGDPASWKAKSEAFRDACKDLKRPLAMRKGDKLREQLEVVRKACDSCHNAHRPE